MLVYAVGQLVYALALPVYIALQSVALLLYAVGQLVYAFALPVYVVLQPVALLVYVVLQPVTQLVYVVLQSVAQLAHVAAQFFQGFRVQRRAGLHLPGEGINQVVDGLCDSLGLGGRHARLRKVLTFCEHCFSARHGCLQK